MRGSSEPEEPGESVPDQLDHLAAAFLLLALFLELLLVFVPGDEPLVVLVGWGKGRSPRPDAPGVPVFCCEHPPGPPTCWCRPPLPGLVLLAAHRHGIALDRSRLVGSTAGDRRLAEAAGVAFVEAGTEAPPR